MEQDFVINKYFAKKNNHVQCLLCPHECIISEGHTGLCKTRKLTNKSFISLVYGRPCAIHIAPIEKKPLFHYHPGKEILSLGTLGCNLFCKGCQNYDISRASASLQDDFVGPEEIVQQTIDAGLNMIAYTYNEPTIFFEYMIDIAKIARKKKIKNIIVSNGYINPGPLKELLKYIDAANIDLKAFNDKFYKEYSNAELAPILETIKTIHKSGRWIELTNLLIPKMNDDMKEIEDMCAWTKNNLDKSVPLHFSRFFPYYKAKNAQITPTDSLIQAKEIATREGLEYVYVGNIGANDATLCPECKNLLIKRNPTVSVVGIKNNKCIKCNYPIKGVF